jgi:hypothetical protein
MSLGQKRKNTDAIRDKVYTLEMKFSEMRGRVAQALHRYLNVSYRLSLLLDV